MQPEIQSWHNWFVTYKPNIASIAVYQQGFYMRGEAEAFKTNMEASGWWVSAIQEVKR